jgi:pimeloyl-ACP methyl ester carboxylesterase
MIEVPQPVTVIDAVAPDGAVLRVRRHGNAQAATRLFISHGNGFAIDGYIEFWRHFLADFDVVVFDMRNHGQNSLAEPPHHDYPHMTADIDAVAKAARAAFGAKPAAGVFHSMSAQAALIQALQGGDHFAALVLFDPPNVPPHDGPARQAMLGYLRMLTIWAGTRRDSFADPSELAQEFTTSRTGRAWTETTPDTMGRAVLRQTGAGWVLSCPRELEASMYRQGMMLDLWPRQDQLAVPVTLIGADPERAYAAVTGLSNRDLANEGGFDYRRLADTSHLMQLEQPNACAGLVVDILKKLRLA